MTAVLRSPSHLPSSPSSSLSITTTDASLHTMPLLSDDPSTAVEREKGGEEEEEESGGRKGRGKREEEEEDQLSLLALLVAVFRKSVVGCNTEREKGLMEIGWPTNVRHVAHVTFDRFHGFLGLPVEFEPEVPRRAPSASANVFGVSTESMQCSFDSRGNSVPTILLLMQRRLYSQGGLQAEGIFRINAENSQEEHVRDQLNSGIVPDGIDVHCLAGLIKAWLRELPTGVLDTLTSEQVMQCQSEEECVALVKLLPPTDAALLDWAINLMADVVQEEHQNKMNARNIAMVFAPNMTQMDDPLTALMYAVQVMNFLKTLIERTLKERQESAMEAASASHSDPTDDNGHRSPPRLSLETHTDKESAKTFVTDEPVLGNTSHLPVDNSIADAGGESSRFARDTVPERTGSSTDGQPHVVPTRTDNSVKGSETVVNAPKAGGHVNCYKNKTRQSSNLKHKKGMKKVNGQPALLATTAAEKSKGISIMSRINSRTEWVETWR